MWKLCKHFHIRICLLLKMSLLSTKILAYLHYHNMCLKIKLFKSLLFLLLIASIKSHVISCFMYELHFRKLLEICLENLISHVTKCSWENFLRFMLSCQGMYWFWRICGISTWFELNFGVDWIIYYKVAFLNCS